MITVKVLGPGCANCRRLEEMARKAALDANVEVQIEKVTSHEGILAYSVLTTPGLVVNERVVSSGRIPAPEAIAGWLKEAAALA